MGNWKTLFGFFTDNNFWNYSSQILTPCVGQSLSQISSGVELSFTLTSIRVEQNFCFPSLNTGTGSCCGSRLLQVVCLSLMKIQQFEKTVTYTDTIDRRAEGLPSCSTILVLHYFALQLAVIIVWWRHSSSSTVHITHSSICNRITL